MKFEYGSYTMYTKEKEEGGEGTEGPAFTHLAVHQLIANGVVLHSLLFLTPTHERPSIIQHNHPVLTLPVRPCHVLHPQWMEAFIHAQDAIMQS